MKSPPYDPRIFEPVRRHRLPGDPPANLSDEVWDSEYVEMPPHDVELCGLLADLTRTVPLLGDGFVASLGCNVSDREDDWRLNYRCPDFQIVGPDSTARNRETHFLGGPDLLVEIVSPGDRSRQKLGFYAAVGTRELFVLDREPWELELYRLAGGELRSVGTTAPGGDPLRTEAVPLRWSLTAGVTPAVTVSAAG